MMSNNQKIQADESGLISIAVTMIIAAMLTLMAVGFAKLSGREFRQALDQQLSSQAFYAAESGINAAIINPNPTTSCMSPAPISPGSNAAVTCVLVNDEPTTLEYSDISNAGSTVIPLHSSDPAAIRSITISWQSKDGKSVFSTDCDGKLFKPSDWGEKTPVMSAMLIPAQGFVDRNALNNETQKLLLYPSASGVCGAAGQYAASVNAVDKGGHSNASCNTSNAPKYCSVTINGLDTTVGGNDYVLRLISVYGHASVSITAIDTTGNNVRFEDAQVEIDSTGKASDVVRRLKVNIPHTDNKWANKLYPEFTVESVDGLCKRLVVVPGSPVTVQNAGNPMCDLPAGILPGAPPAVGGGGAPTLGSAALVQNPNLPPTGAAYEWQGAVRNSSDPARLGAGGRFLVSCTYKWRDGSATTTQVFPGNHPNCQNGTTVVHRFPNYQALIERTGGADGCYRHNVTITNVFNNGAPTTTSVPFIIETPSGLANDVPGGGPLPPNGICFGKFRRSPFWNT
ncbi:MAG: pilus assembly PilX N-terminal domain-containing protein [Candidatus Saccharimonadales bacterium]